MFGDGQRAEGKLRPLAVRTQISYLTPNRPRRPCSPLTMSSVCATKSRQRRRYCHDWLTAQRRSICWPIITRGEHAKALSLLKQCVALNGGNSESPNPCICRFRKGSTEPHRVQ